MKTEDSPLEVHCGDVEDNSFKPQDHEEPLRERAVPNAFSITPRLKHTDRSQVRTEANSPLATCCRYDLFEFTNNDVVKGYVTFSHHIDVVKA